MIDKDDWDELIANTLMVGAILVVLVPWAVGVYSILAYFTGRSG